MKSNDTTVLAVSFLPANGRRTVVERFAKVYLQNFRRVNPRIPPFKDFSICSAEKKKRKPNGVNLRDGHANFSEIRGYKSLGASRDERFLFSLSLSFIPREQQEHAEVARGGSVG